MITDKIQTQVDLFPHNTLRMRTVAEEFVVVLNRDELVEAISYAQKKGVPFWGTPWVSGNLEGLLEG